MAKNSVTYFMDGPKRCGCRNDESKRIMMKNEKEGEDHDYKGSDVVIPYYHSNESTYLQDGEARSENDVLDLWRFVDCVWFYHCQRSLRKYQWRTCDIIVLVLLHFYTFCFNSELSANVLITQHVSSNREPSEYTGT